MQRGVVGLFERWQLTDTEASILLGEISPRTLQRWKQGQYGRVGIDLAARMSNLLGIHRALRMLLAYRERGYDWIRQPNSAFEDRRAFDVMLGGQITDLMRVRRYLDAQRAFW
ncbi:MAG: MbcA/ParS/Xre antitoxin family protein [Thalassobaculaceae bacterium]